MIVAMALAHGCRGPADPAPPVSVDPPQAATPPRPDRRMVLIAGGDVLPHRRVKSTAARLGWASVFSDIVPWLQDADLAFVNLESPVAPDAHRGLHGEVFNAPASLIDGLVGAGVDVVSLANNHAFDQGPAGLVETWTRATEAGLVAVGAGPSCAVASAPQHVEIAGFRVAFLAATDLVNLDGNVTDADPCLFVAGEVCTGDCGPDRDAVHFRPDLDRLTRSIARGRQEADLVVLSMHWGDEYRTAPLPEYPVLAQSLVDAGVDVLIAHHPHVLQPVEWITASDGRRGIVAYSLGNLVSDMARTYRPDRRGPHDGRTRDGALLRLEIAALGDGPTHIVSASLLPTWTDNRPDRITIWTHPTLAAADPALHEIRRRSVGQIIDDRWLGDATP